MHVVTLGLGANLGDRLATLQHAVDLLAEEGVRAVASSRIWRTEPVGGPAGQPAYLNAVVRAQTALEADQVLAAANRVEAALGRSREVRWGPRTIDIDVLLFDEVERDDPALTIPHPRLRERAFVVLPLLDIDADPVLPDGTRVLDLPLDPDDAEPAEPPLAIP